MNVPFFLSRNMLIGCFFWVVILGARVIFGAIPTIAGITNQLLTIKFKPIN